MIDEILTELLSERTASGLPKGPREIAWDEDRLAALRAVTTYFSLLTKSGEPHEGDEVSHKQVGLLEALISQLEIEMRAASWQPDTSPSNRISSIAE